MATPEGRVKAQVTKILQEFKSDLYYEMPVPGGYGKSGLDYIGCIKGQMFSVETKAPGKRPTKRQDMVIDKMRRAGAKVFVIDGTSDADVDTYEELKLWLKRVRSGT